MKVIRESEMVQNAVAFRNRMNKTNCSIEDIMRIYIDIPVSDYICNDGKIGGFFPHKRKLKKRNYFV